jgi:hypothetical protein
MSVSRQLRSLRNIALSLPFIVACAPIESSQCSALVFQPHGGNALSGNTQACPVSRVYSYDPTLFEQQASWAESSHVVPAKADEVENKQAPKI